jgi:carbon storage regulator
VLVLIRKQGESVVIGNDILVTVLEVRGDQIRLGIDAPRSVTVHRQEVYLQVASENSAAIASADRGSPLLRRPVPKPVAKRDTEP